MIPFVVLFLFATSALGADLSNYDENRHRSESRDSHTVHLQPDSKISYNFEQRRRDQPPQVEMREENVGRYFHSRPTTTTPRSIFSMKAENEAQHVYPVISPKNNCNRNDFSSDELSRDDNNGESWSETPKSTVPPPPTLAFPRKYNEWFQREFQSPQYHVQPMKVAQPQNEYRHVVRHYQPHPSQIQQTVQPAMQWTEENHFPSHNIVPTPAPYVDGNTKESEIRFSPSASYVSDSVNDNKQTYHHNMPRGHHKFNDLRINYEEVAPVRNHHENRPTTVRAMSDNKPPPPAPTLSPWYDGFRK